jgi:hypothetical protein
MKDKNEQLDIAIFAKDRKLSEVDKRGGREPFKSHAEPLRI